MPHLTPPLTLLSEISAKLAVTESVSERGCPLKVCHEIIMPHLTSPLTITIRNLCKACRYREGLRAGMSIEGFS